MVRLDLVAWRMAFVLTTLGLLPGRFDEGIARHIRIVHATENIHPGVRNVDKNS